MAAAACGGDDGGQIIFADGGGSDGGAGATCNPVSQQGCAAGEKCASVEIQASPSIIQTLCVPDGTAAVGEACETGEPGPDSGYDNCLAGAECIFDECREICRQSGQTAGGTCPDGEAVEGPDNICQIFNGLFDDLDTQDFGICIPACDPTAGIARDGTTITFDYTADCGEALQCYMNLFDGLGVCSGSFEGAPSHDDECPDRNNDGDPDCALNGCAPGHGPFKPGGSLQDWQGRGLFFANTVFGLDDTCVQFCDPTQWYGADNPMAEQFQAQCPANNACLLVNGLYLNSETPDFAPNTFGLCMPLSTSGWSDCSNHEPRDVGAYLVPDGVDPNNFSVDTNNKFIPGCSTGAETFEVLEDCSSDEPTGACPEPGGCLDGCSTAAPRYPGKVSKASLKRAIELLGTQRIPVSLPNTSELRN